MELLLCAIAASIVSALAAAASILISYLLLPKQCTHSPSSSTKQRPPPAAAGPRKLPIIGNLHQIAMGGELVHLTLARLAKTHGPVFTLWLGGNQPTVVVSHHKPAWEVLVTKSSHFSSRTFPSISKFINADFRTIIGCDPDHYWHSLRKALHSTVVGPAAISAHTDFHHHLIAAMVAALRGEADANGGGSVVRPLLHLRHSTISLISRLIFGPGVGQDIAFMEEMDETIEEALRLLGHARFVDVFDFLKHVPGLRMVSFHSRISKSKRRIEALLLPHVSAHLSAQEECPGCYIHSLVSQDVPLWVIAFCVFEVFLLGVDSTANSILWALAFLTSNPQVQEKLHAEICKSGWDEDKEGVMGGQDVAKVEYLKAVVKETMRMKPIAPLGVPHSAGRESSIMGRKVGRGTNVVVNLHAVMNDPEVWEEPQEFRPERFMGGSRRMGEEGCFIPFGAGMRICGGMELGKLHVGMCIANLVMRFRWLPEVDGRMPDMTEDLSFVLTMKYPMAARIIPRF